MGFLTISYMFLQDNEFLTVNEDASYLKVESDVENLNIDLQKMILIYLWLFHKCFFNCFLSVS